MSIIAMLWSSRPIPKLLTVPYYILLPQVTFSKHMKTQLCTLAVVMLTTSAFAEIDFNQQIRPILSDKCFKCHGPDAKNQKSKFRLDTFEHATETHDGVVGVVPGKLEESELHWRIRTDDDSELMPPPKSKMKLTAKEKDLLDQWIKEGATYEEHWSLVPLPRELQVPKSEGKWARNEIDHFIKEKLKGSELQTSEEVNRETWLRRVTFDLTGLAPTLEELDAFLADKSKDAYEKVVDRLLNSDGYAERMTSEWLDVARYADTYGYQQDKPRNVWHWRDWVIRAFQQNLSYKDFITWQLAGDLLPNATRDQILATTFNRLHSQKVEGGSVPEEFRIEYVADRVHTFGTAFLGLSFECSRCHDHKYDPLTMKDYYSLSAFFNNIDEAGLYSFFTGSVPTPTLELGDLPSDEKIRVAEAKLEEIAKSEDARKARIDAEIIYTKPIAHLSFDKLEGSKVPNLIDPAKPANTSGNNQSVEGKLGNGLKLTGDDAVKFPNGLGDFKRYEPFTLAIWVQPTMTHDRAVILRRSKAWTDAASRGYELLIEDGKLSAALIHFWPGNAIRVMDPKPLPLNEWTHVGITYDGSSKATGLKIYRNGKLVKSDIVRNNLTREITGGGDPYLAIGERMRDKGFKNGLVDELYVFNEELTSTEINFLRGAKVEASEDDLFQIFLRTAHKPYQDQLEALRKARDEYAGARQKLQEIMVMREMPCNRETFILERGHYASHGEKVSANTPEFLPALPQGAPRNRLGLAQWLTSPDHPMFARVTVNRYWQMIFGRGLVSTTEDFGSQGKPPTHPELLDWLSRDFMDSGWDLHHLLKNMVLSATYRQSSFISLKAREIDPENLLLARGPAYKLSSEMIRDSVLQYSGLLNRNIGGPGVKPYDLAVSFKPMNHDRAPNLHRRSVYTYWKRTAPAPVMMALDSSKREVCMVKRERTDSAPQTLVLLNGPQFIEAARATAEKLINEHGDQQTQIAEQAFRLFTSRYPTDQEKEILAQLLDEQLEAFQDPNKANQFLSTGEHKAKTDNPALQAAVTVLISTLQNYDESISKR
jgi:hypothetical protein